jgi:endoglucanase
VKRPRRKPPLARRCLSGAAAIACVAIAGAFSHPAFASASPLSIRIEGNHFVNGEGQTIRLLGVDRTSSEYGCVDGFGYDDGHFDAVDAAAIAGWNANAVRVPLNEDCWLGINGQPNTGEAPLTMAGYRQEIENYVADLNAHGIYAILDLHWTAPGNQVALEQQPMPDAHSVPFWESVAATFKSNPAVVFDVFNEPYSPTDPRSGDDMNPAHEVSWNCWENGGCTTQAYDENDVATSAYTVVGMQALVNAIRGTGATQPVMVGGLDFADDLSQWATHAPDDPLNQEAASFHNYMGKQCDNVGCWNSEIAPLATAVPVVTGEFAEDNFENPTCPEGPNNFDNEYMGWADAHGVSYLAWAWVVLSAPEIKSEGCSAFYLIGDYGGTPASVNGVAVHSHLLALPPGGRTTFPATGTGAGSGGAGGGAPKSVGPKIKLLRFRDKVLPGGKVSFQLEAAQSCTAKIAGQTVKSFKVGGRKPRKVGLGSANLSLTADKPATVTLKLPAKAAQLLKSKGSLKARFTVTLSGGGNATTVAPHTVTLKEPQPKKH